MGMKLNESYVSSLQSAENTYNVELQDGEKVLFAAKLSTWGDEKDQSLGMNAVFTMTDRKIVVDNGAGIWKVAIEDVADVTVVHSGKWIFKTTYLAVSLKEPMSYEEGRGRLNGFHFYFGKQEEAVMEAMMKELFWA